MEESCVDTSCQLCKIIENAKLDLSYIGESKISSIFLNYNQRHMGRCILALKDHYDAIYKVPHLLQQSLWGDLLKLYEAISRAFNPLRINIALLGNKIPHIHWHLIPRYPDEENIYGPPWPNSELRLRDREFLKIKKTILKELEVNRDEI